MKKLILFLTFLLLFIACTGCNDSKPSVTIKSVEYVDSIDTSGGVSYKYEGQKIIKLVFDFTFDAKIVADLDQNSDDYRSEVYGIIVDGAHLFNDDQEISLTYGYWPKKSGSNFASDLTIFYVVPDTAENFRLTFDGDVLGDGTLNFDEIINPK